MSREWKRRSFSYFYASEQTLTAFNLAGNKINLGAVQYLADALRNNQVELISYLEKLVLTYILFCARL